MKNEKWMILVFVVVFIVLIGLVYAQYYTFQAIGNLEAKIDGVDSEVRVLEGEVDAVSADVAKWRTDLLETNNQLNARMSSIESKIS